jgi:hypothetical protein
MLVRVPRWRRLVSFVAKWHERPLAEGDGVDPREVEAAEARLGFPLPRALGEWFRLVGTRDEVIGDPTLPAQLCVEGGVLTVYGGPGWSARWGIETGHVGDADPPIVMVHPYRPTLRPQNDTVSEFCLTIAIHHRAWRSRGFGGWASDTGAFRVFERSYPALPLPAWYWPGDPRRCFGDADTIVVLAGVSQIAVAARTGEAARRAHALAPPGSWSHFVGL